MALRFATKNIAISANGNTIAHGLGTTPDSYWIVQHGPSNVWLSSAVPTTANIYITCSNNTGGGTASIFAVVNHSIIK